MGSPVADLRVVKGACPHDCPDTCALETTVENGRAFYVVRGPRDQRYEVEAAALIEAALEGREIVDAAPSAAH